MTSLAPHSLAALYFPRLVCDRYRSSSVQSRLLRSAVWCRGRRMRWSQRSLDSDHKSPNVNYRLSSINSELEALRSNKRCSCGIRAAPALGLKEVLGLTFCHYIWTVECLRLKEKTGAVCQVKWRTLPQVCGVFSYYRILIYSDSNWCGWI